MKFLCVPCDRPMTLEGKRADGGSIALRYACPDCGYEMAMLTNPMETQVVGSLGVRLGADGAEEAGESKCPFTGMVRGLEAEPAAAPPAEGGVPWTPEAEARMRDLPDFVRPMVIRGIERFAVERGHDLVDERVLRDARRAMGLD